MSAITAFASPNPAAVSLSFGLSPQKRKRHTTSRKSGQEYAQTSNDDISDSRLLSAEYSAVITPAERTQRRLAGLPSDQQPPLPPFPHAAERPQRRPEPERLVERDGRAEISTRTQKPYLHAQHLAAVSAILQRSMMNRDYARARRAMGLILHQEVGGRAIDIRNDGLWGIGAEIILRSSTKADTGTRRPLSSLTQDDFEHCKLYYENLMIQYPPHKTWPNAVNALDFCIAMFGLWIYVTHQVSQRIRTTSHPDASEDTITQDRTSFYECIMWELEQAKRIAEALDLRMKDVLYRDHPELIRLRNMIRLWNTDLLELSAQSDDDRSSL